MNSKIFFDIHTGKVHRTRTANRRRMMASWTPYYTLGGKFFGYRAGSLGFKKISEDSHVGSYWDM